MQTFGSILLKTDNDSALARAVGVSPQTIGRWRKNEEVIPLGKALALAKVQGMKLSLIRPEKVYS